MVIFSAAAVLAAAEGEALAAPVADVADVCAAAVLATAPVPAAASAELEFPLPDVAA
ncbi:hypothetical protein KDL01_34260 [Actinospica durhamensis]|uniref:Uncharacterized protein n=1 Tax=Actinospica durhamensis TaxID=1508375 RepID=A0A941F0R3_9ACTN|nr:hypothetical protein [Actinospica durhamensis]MBR7838384.1 hypothetical protein [Actinospica durhamensis]